MFDDIFAVFRMRLENCINVAIPMLFQCESLIGILSMQKRLRSKSFIQIVNAAY